MDGSQKKRNGSNSRRLRHEDDIVEEVFKLGRSKHRRKRSTDSHCIVCDERPSDTDVTVAESVVIPSRAHRDHREIHSVDE
jgi:hypothetical protein